METTAPQVERLVLNVHQRNGGKLDHLDFNLRLLDPSLVLDSLDIAEIVVAIEKQFSYSPFDASPPPRTWAELLAQLVEVTQARVPRSSPA